MPEENLDLGKLIKRKREELRYNLRKAEDLTGLNASYIAQIEKGKKGVSEDVLDKLALGLNIDRDTLYVSARMWPPSVPRTQERLKKLYER